MNRRDFLRCLGGAGAAVAVARVAAAQEAGGAPASAPSNLFEMDQAAAQTVRRPPKSGARRSMTDAERDALEHELRCQCGCTLDVYTCRTTDFACQVSPAMHRDIVALVDGGYSAPEILDAFTDTYGERALMAPRRAGFNWVGYLMPFAALAAGGAAVVTLLGRMQGRGGRRSSPVAPSAAATADELARLEQLVRRDV